MSYLLFPLVVYIPVGTYLYFFFRRFLGLFGLEKQKKAVRILSLLITLACVAKGWMLYGLGAVIILHFFVFSILMDGIYFICRGKFRKKKARKIWGFLHASGVIPLLVICLIAGYGYFNINDIRRTEYRIETEKQLSRDLKILQISDLHMGTTMDIGKLKDCCDKMQREKPDLIALTGDIFDENTSRQEMEAAAKVLGDIEAEYGTYYVFGNHDYNAYTGTPVYSPEELCSILESSGIVVLKDQVYTVNDELTVIGRTDASVGSMVSPKGRTGIEELCREIDGNTFVLLLDHQPTELRENAEAGVDLQLSDHTHAGQIWPTGQVGELIGFTELNYGWKEIGGLQVIVSSGIGGWGYPIRTGGHSEYVVVTVSAEKNAHTARVFAP